LIPADGATAVFRFDFSWHRWRSKRAGSRFALETLNNYPPWLPAICQFAASAAGSIGGRLYEDSSGNTVEIAIADILAQSKVRTPDIGDTSTTEDLGTAIAQQVSKSE
jgi:hypothetical protein